MKFIVLMIILQSLFSCQKIVTNEPFKDVDLVSKASGKYEYKESSYSYNSFIDKLQRDSEGNILPAVALATVNDDDTPNIAIFIPKLIVIEETHYLLTWVESDTRTYQNLKNNKLGYFLFHEYDYTVKSPKGGTEKEKTIAKMERHKGCRVLVRFVGDEKQNELAEKYGMPEIFRNNNLLLEIENVLPLG